MNVQARLIAGIPLSLFGFVGITEKYSDSLNFINHKYNFNLSELSENSAEDGDNQRSHLTCAELTDDVKKVIIKLNHEDVILYNQAKNLFNTRVAYKNKNIQYVHNAITFFPYRNVISGCMWVEDGADEVAIDLLYQGQYVDQYLATELLEDFIFLSPPRDGKIGLSIDLKKYGIEQTNFDGIELKVRDTGQIIPVRLSS